MFVRGRHDCDSSFLSSQVVFENDGWRLLPQCLNMSAKLIKVMADLDAVAAATSDWLAYSRKAQVERVEAGVDVLAVVLEQPAARKRELARLAQHVIDVVLVVMQLHHAWGMSNNLDFVLVCSYSFRCLKRVRGEDDGIGEEVSGSLVQSVENAVLGIWEAPSDMQSRAGRVDGCDDFDACLAAEVEGNVGASVLVAYSMLV